MKGIIFDAESVRAILRGHKTQTRRIVKPQPVSGVRRSVFVPSGIEDGHGREIKVHYRPRDVVYVRETFGTSAKVPASMVLSAGVKTEYLAYRADEPEGNWCWRSPIHMPEWAARIKLQICDVRVQRLQDITNEDATAEGVIVGCDSRDWYAERWDAINHKRAPWESNPWVWVYEFRRVEQ